MRFEFCDLTFVLLLECLHLEQGRLSLRISAGLFEIRICSTEIVLRVSARMAGTGNYASAVFLAVVMIMVGAGGAAAADVTTPSPSPTMEAGAASMAVVPSLFVALIASFILFLASRFC